MADDPRKEPTTESQPRQPEKPTTKLDKDEITRQLLDKVLLKLTDVGNSQAEMTESQNKLAGKVDVLGGKVDTITVDVHAIKAEQVEIREWKGAVEERFKTHSMGTKALSVHDGDQDMKLQELENRLAIAAESSMRAILVEAKEAAKTPLGRKVVTATGAFLLTALTAGTLYLGVVTARLQGQQQQPVQYIQVAPVAVDGGAR